jgi:hypothetical protein
MPDITIHIVNRNAAAVAQDAETYLAPSRYRPPRRTRTKESVRASNKPKQAASVRPWNSSTNSNRGMECLVN